MSLIALETNLPPDPLALARRVWGAETPMLLWTRDGSGPSFVACDPIAIRAGLDPEPSLRLDPSLGRWGFVPRWVGVLPYEAERARLERASWVAPDERPLPLLAEPAWWRYAAVAVVDTRVTLVGDDPVAIGALKRHLESGVIAGIESVIRPITVPDSEPSHRVRIESALERIRAGDIYQINLARRLDVSVEGSTLGLLASLCRWADAGYCAALEVPGDDGVGVVSTSPELFLELGPDRRVVTMPIKGTRPRGRDAAEDALQPGRLHADPKERAELSMVVDVERNDLGRVAEFGTVVADAPVVTRHATLFHRQARVAARLRTEVTRASLLEATLPSGSVTGAPKIRAMEVIRELEAERRGLYTGALGFVSHDGGLRLAMAIRTLCRKGGLGQYFIGGGIVADSDPALEVEETLWKAAQLVRALVT
jgi:anthranilate/para-aminobenzoate synthase component I